MEKAGAEIHVGGRVQGVWFRAFTQKHARRLGLTGTCENLDDGRVRVVVEGDRPAIEELFAHLRKGPPGASVDTFKSEWMDYSGDYDGFRISY